MLARAISTQFVEFFQRPTIFRWASVHNTEGTMIRRLPLALLVLSACATTLADTLLNMPDGGTCWMNNVGFVYGCTGGALDSEAAADSRELAQALEMQAQAEQGRQAALTRCLRLADMPKQPGREECVQMWGR
jgi:hypothetical protein